MPQTRSSRLLLYLCDMQMRLIHAERTLTHQEHAPAQTGADAMPKATQGPRRSSLKH